jgi:hypothetical protein
MYGPDAIALGRKNISRFEWARSVYEDIKRQARGYLEMDRERLRSFISDKTPVVTVRCPECGCGPWYAFTLIDGGDALQCKDCGATWPWDETDDGEIWTPQGVMRSHRLHAILAGGLPAFGNTWRGASAYAAGLVYQIEGDLRYAEKAAVLVERFAEVFKGYRPNMVNQNEWCEASAYYGKIDGWKRHDANAVRRVLLAYDLIRDAGVLSDRQCERIDRDLVGYAHDYFIDGFDDGDLLSYSSIQDMGGVWWCIAASGALLGNRRTLESIVDLYERLCDPRNGVFHADGTFFECTASYQIGLFTEMLGIPEIVRSGLGVDLYSHPSCGLLRKCLTWFLDSIYPDGTMPAVNDCRGGQTPPLFCSEIAQVRYGDPKALRHLKDTWGETLSGGTDVSLFYRDPESDTDGRGEPFGQDSVHFPGMGLMILRHGEQAADRTMAFLDYGPLVPKIHKHPDYLNLGIWACGVEMVSDMGYNWNPDWVRLWQREPRSHNTVLELATQEEGGEPLIWCITPGIQMAEAGVPGASTRFIALLPRCEGEPLLVDILRVSGDCATYTWMIHARSDRLSLDGVGPMAPVDVDPPLRNGRTGRTKGDVSAVWAPGSDGSGGLQVLVPVVGPSKVTRSECPPEGDEIIRTHRDGGTVRPGAVVPFRGHLQITRPGPRATFVAIHAPFSGDRPPPLTGDALTVEHDGETLMLRLAVGGEAFEVVHDPVPGHPASGPIQTDGRAAAAVLRDGKVASIVLAGGTFARTRDEEIRRGATGNAYGIADKRGMHTCEIA